MKKYTLILFFCFFLKTIYAQPSITQQPVSVTACENSTVQFKVTATGTSLTYQWQINYLMSWYDINPMNLSILKSFLPELAKTNITGYNANTLTIEGVNFALNSRNIHCIVKDGGNNSVTSNDVNITVHVLPLLDKNSVFKGCEPNQIAIKVNTILYSTADIASCTYQLTRNTTTVNTVDDSNPLTVSSKFPLQGDSTGKYYLTVISRSDAACKRTDTMDIHIQRVWQKDSISLVTYDTKSKEYKVLWNVTAGMGSDSCNIYAKTFALKQYGTTSPETVTDVIAKVPVSYGGVYNAAAIDPAIQTAKFAIRIIDTCGHVSSQSPVHMPIHVESTIDSINNKVVLKWNDYRGIAYSKFYIHRYSKLDSIHLRTHAIDSIVNSSDTVNTWTDTKPVPNNFYAISINLPKTFALKSLLKSESGPYTQSLSNIVEYKVTPSSEDLIGTIPASVYPNPFENAFNLEFTLDEPSDVQLEILNILGEKEIVTSLGKLAGANNAIQISADQLKAGIYFVKISGAGKVTVLKIIKK